MAKPSRVIVLHSGGLRSLVATAMVLDRPDPVEVTLLHLVDGRPAGELRREYLQRQADHYGLRHVVELDRSFLFGQPTSQRPDGLPEATLTAPRMLFNALAYAHDHRADELIWPISHHDDTAKMAQAQETQILCEQLRTTDPSRRAMSGAASGDLLQTPLLGYRDERIVEIGRGLDVPWELSWSCVLNASSQCGACPACRRRRAAFQAAGVVDPVFAPARR